MTVWSGTAPTSCDFGRDCRGDGKITSTFIDGKTVFGPWANMCLTCHGVYGVGLGTGIGQRYHKQPDGTFKKMEG